MAILLRKTDRVVVQGITGKYGAFHTRLCMEYGTKITAGVTPGKGGEFFENNIPIFDTLKEAKAKTDCNVSLIFVPAPFAADAIVEAVDCQMDLIICITEGIPTFDMAKVKRLLFQENARLVGPNCPGIITPGESKAGIMPGYIHKPGKVGVVSRSGTLTYEAVWQLTRLGLGQSSCVGIGGDPIHGLSIREVVELFWEDPQTEAVLIIGEIGGVEEQEAAQWIKENPKKPVAAFVAGLTAPVGKRMGHAGAIILGQSGTVTAKIEAFKEAGIKVIPSVSEIGRGVYEAIEEWKDKK
ncbi:succinate--CoA ligase subunit alpha [Candidatus Methylacidiphilum fumarolicum]|uniref:Succinate--CoA ligase [ADP-forming] subunit alpha n=2 Tax=Candidatus Methylacidiphilum fumarolicum TaxID=591154 RepID=I0JWI6_METFB|nr:succinate--CoA ligase subunit alpha [Candidatus Methylacidiphilum fumarolicum]MBW6415345.1 succinate--CoA ligase subunit alpha [Candidatus Methylacidiphilum fumarolicum]TFE68673.1 succinate--CoA ligase subunit alpha [Candidatus Methylacidiphilum fumarolicum]TFE72569.1 succinate--CoA ligase subunit alpha [Candidatus Methylacidiphilum fumarolicum]TFE73886.1 succinate--CoA ligase subunit alpha [Candidatus Methylacidiphilum fumarolicum]TFE77506.1 succinate--CoA ligase subunit alpha [Candidatus 